MEEINNKTRNIDNTSTKKPPSKKRNIFQRIFDFLFGGSDPDSERKRILHDITNVLKKQRIKYYRPKHELAEPALAKIFYEFYRTLGPAQSLVKYADYSGVLKTIIIESVLSKEQLMQRELLDERSIRERAKATDLKMLSDQIKDELVTIISFFNSDKVKEIHHIYFLLSLFVDVAHFDYFFLLKKFDSNLPEGDFFYQPRFEAINGEYVVDDLKDFLDIIAPFEESSSWQQVFDILKEYRGVDVVSRHAWKKLVNRMREIKKSNIFLLIIKHIEKDPYYKVKVSIKKKRIVDEYLAKLKAQTQLVLQKIYKEMHDNKVDQFTKQVFGTSSISRLKNYTAKANINFAKKMLGGFIFVQPLNYLKAFLLDYLKKDIRTLVDLLLIKGKWTSNIVSQQLSESFHQLLDISDQITKMDESLDEDAELGIKFKTYIHKADKDKTCLRVLRQMLKEINDMAKAMIHTSAQHLISIGKNLKVALEDYKHTPHEMILNWKEIENSTDKSLDDQIVTVYKKIYYFIKLLQVFVKEK